MALDLPTLTLLIAVFSLSNPSTVHVSLEQESVQDSQAKNTEHMYFLIALCCWLIKRNLQQSKKANNKMIFEKDETFTVTSVSRESLQESKCK